MSAEENRREQRRRGGRGGGRKEPEITDKYSEGLQEEGPMNQARSKGGKVATQPKGFPQSNEEDILKRDRFNDIRC